MSPLRFGRPRVPAPAMSVVTSAGAVLAGIAIAAGCGGAAPAAAVSAAAGRAPGKAAAGVQGKAGDKGKAGGKGAPKPGGRGEGAAMVTPSRLLPDLVGDRGVVALEDGHRRVLVDRMRLVAHEDGSLERAAELLPRGQVTAMKLPSRLGGGFVFHASTRGGTQLWRAGAWLGKLEPLVQLSSEASEVIPGFDRLYVRLTQNNRLLAVDARSGEQMPLGPLPPAAGYGQIAFADGWRAVVEADLRGPLATFDAGSTWQHVEIEGRPSAIGIVGGDPALIVGDGYYAIDARGGVTHRTLGSSRAEDSEDPPARPPGPFGRRPLRAALEDGWPDSATTAVVARGGALGRISLRDGAVLEVVQEAYRDRRASCHAVRMGGAPSAPAGGAEAGAKPAAAAPFGFICGERDGATALYTFQPPLAMREVMRFKRPRFISPSGNGALVVRGPCGDDGAAPGARAYCVLSPDPAAAPGSPASFRAREIRVKASNQDLGIERVIALADGRVAVLVPPRAGASGQLTLLRGSEAATVPLTLPAKPRSAGRELRRGMWLEGFEEREPGVIGGWVEAGGPIVGVRIDAKDGKVKAGEVRNDATGALLSGRFALSLGEGDLAAESTDGGMTWQTFDVPERDDDPGASPTRACGPVGCAWKGWLRVGWGKPAAPEDLAQAEAPAMLYTPLRTSSPLSMTCEALGSSTPPLPEKPQAAPQAPPARPPPRFGPIQPPQEVASTAWLPFRNTPAPALAAGEVGFDNGAPYDIVSMRAYAWGKRGADWTRVGRWLVRFDDRFDPAGGVRSSAPSASPWADEVAASEALGGYSYGMASWGAFLDAGGRAALVQAWRGPG
ncbi:MAG: hypothetical protein IT372_20150, partial [Polyangiaceae bacterium]|nr:hypothetical protein [Polyangiaceae bacterium]